MNELEISQRELPPFLNGKVEYKTYKKWLHGKAAAHARRDQKRWGGFKSGAEYRNAIHAAVLASDGKDAYTGAELDWTLISQYNNAESKLGRHQYKAGFALLPTLDHVESENPSSAFCICGWRTNDSKHDLSTKSFVALCVQVLKHHGYEVTKLATTADD